MGIHWQELVVILLIVLVLFGPKRMPEIGSSLGKGIRGFKESLNGQDAVKATVAAEESKQGTTPRAIPVPVEVVETTTASSSIDTKI